MVHFPRLAKTPGGSQSPLYSPLEHLHQCDDRRLDGELSHRETLTVVEKEAIIIRGYFRRIALGMVKEGVERVFFHDSERERI